MSAAEKHFTFDANAFPLTQSGGAAARLRFAF